MADRRASALNIFHKLSKNQSLDDLYIDKTKVDLQTKISWTRMKRAAQDCGNCFFLEFQHLYCTAIKCDYYDKKNNLAYYCDAWHLNSYGASKIVPSLTDFLNKLSI